MLSPSPTALRRLPRFAAVLLAAIAAVSLAGLLAAPPAVVAQPSGSDDPPPAPSAEEPERISPPDRTVSSLLRAGAAVLQRIWWNRAEMVEALALRDDQRRAMDRLLLDHLDQRRETAREQQALRLRLGDELAAGRWEAAAATGEALGEITGSFAATEAALALEVTRLLDPAQRQRLDAEHPRLLRVPWVRSPLGPTRLRNQPNPRRPPGR